MNNYIYLVNISEITNLNSLWLLLKINIIDNCLSYLHFFFYLCYFLCLSTIFLFNVDKVFFKKHINLLPLFYNICQDIRKYWVILLAFSFFVICIIFLWLIYISISVFDKLSLFCMCAYVLILIRGPMLYNSQVQNYFNAIKELIVIKNSLFQTLKPSIMINVSHGVFYDQ